jgi:hypothetical protein
MKKMKTIAAAVGVALSLGVASQAANAVMEYKPGGKGDALLFPFYKGSPGWENYYTITNSANAWIQGHIRFRGAAWCGELRDFDIILSPGDVFVFRLADLDGDGLWEIDQSLDPQNFRYTGLHPAVDQTHTKSISICNMGGTGQTEACMDSSTNLMPSEPDAIITEEILAHQRELGYIEFIGEAVLDNMNHTIMSILLDAQPRDWAPYQTDVFYQRGTSAWKWSNAANHFAVVNPPQNNGVWVGDRGLSDVPNALSGVGFVSLTGTSSALTFNADAILNFRTGVNDHRIDNYRLDINGDPLPHWTPADRAVIVHHENGAADGDGISPFGDYVYRFPLERPESNVYEGRISFNNTWGPTLGDGDDYDLSRTFDNGKNVYGRPVNLRWTQGTLDNPTAMGNPDDNQIDDWDIDLAAVGDPRPINSIAEVEEAIREGGQTFSAFYFDNAGFGAQSAGSLRSWFIAYYPTKFFYGEKASFYEQKTLKAYITQAARFMILRMGKTYNLQVWDINENTGGESAIFIPGQECVSPATLEECFDDVIITGQKGTLTLGHCCNIFDITQVKNAFSSQVSNFFTGRAVFSPQINDPLEEGATKFDRLDWKSYPGLFYEFEWSNGGICGWRPLHR